MTVCIASIAVDHKSNPIILTASDRRLSLYGGYLSSEGTAIKFRSIHPEWMVLFAGDTSGAETLLDAVGSVMKKLKRNTRRNVVDRTRAAYRIERKRMVEQEILADYDIESYAEFSALRSTEPQFYYRIKEKVKEKEESWNLLFAGFDGDGKPHLFAIYENGKITNYDTQNFAAIGAGALSASMYLTAYPYSKRLGLGEAVYAVATAKFFSETASDVGRETLLTAMRPKQKQALVLGDHDVKNVREKWQALPKIPEGIAKDLFSTVAGHLALYQAFPNRETMADGSIRVSATQTQEPET